MKFQRLCQNVLHQGLYRADVTNDQTQEQKFYYGIIIIYYGISFIIIIIIIISIIIIIIIIIIMTRPSKNGMKITKRLLDIKNIVLRLV